MINKIQYLRRLIPIGRSGTINSLPEPSQPGSNLMSIGQINPDVSNIPAVQRQLNLQKQREADLLILGLSISKLESQNPLSYGRKLVNGLEYVSNNKNVHNRDDAGNIILINKK